MNARRDPLDQAIDVLLYAPLGFALEARTLLPQMVDRGRQHVSMARTLGQFAVQQGQIEANKRLERAHVQASSILSDLGLVPDEAVPARSRAARPPAARTPAARTRADAVAREPAPATPGPVADGPAVDDLAVAGYDSLAASQVIPRLKGLSVAELEDVRAYEAAGRGRKTILNRIAQLQSA